MDWPVVLIRTTGIGLFIWTMHSLYLNVKKIKRKKEDSQQAISEQLLNNILLFAWLLFMTSFSLGMIFNN
ncbi:MAG: hypothetical protein ACOCSE_03385 [Chitinivibrionales bacterium]